MSSYLSNIINRHAHSINIVQPRRRSLFEPRQVWSDSFSPLHFGESENRDIHDEASYTETPESPTPQSPVDFGEPPSNPLIPKDTKLKRNAKGRKSVGAKPRVQAQPPPSKEIKENLKKMPSINRRVNQKEANIENKVSKPATSFLQGQQGHQEKRKDVLQIFSDANLKGQPQDLNLGRIAPVLPPTYSVEKKPIRPVPVGRTMHSLPSIHINQENAEQPDNRLDHTSNDTAPTVKIHIGRIDIKAVKQNPLPKTKSPKTSTAGMSLEQFLKNRED